MGVPDKGTRVGPRRPQVPWRVIDDVAFVAIQAPEPGQVMVTSMPCVPAGVGTVNERGAGPVFAPGVHPVPLVLTVGGGVLDGEVEGAGAPDPVPTAVHPVSAAPTAMATTTVHAFLDRTFPPGIRRLLR